MNKVKSNAQNSIGKRFGVAAILDIIEDLFSDLKHPFVVRSSKGQILGPKVREAP